MSDSLDGAPPPGAPGGGDPAPPDPRLDAPADAPAGHAEPQGSGATGDEPYPGAVPPGYDWPTHGGYLGCVMGVVVGLVLGGFLGSLLIGLLSVTPLGGVVSGAAGRLTLLALTFFATLIVMGRLGYRLGRRYYREYPQQGRGEREQ